MTLRFLTAGESHGPALVAILEGIPAGIPLTNDDIDRHLSRRQRGHGSGKRMQIEKDRVQILSGVMAGKTIGAPIALMITNLNHKDWLGKEVPPFANPRPGHADLTGAIKYGFNDLRPVLERASARETAARVAVGAICKHLLAQFNIRIEGYVSSIGEVTASLNDFPLELRSVKAEESSVRCPDPAASDAMKDAIENAIDEGNTLGGILEVLALGLPPGLGSYVHWDKRLDGRLSQAVIGIQAIKGVEIGPAFANSRQPGTKVHDAIRLKDGQLQRSSHRSGGIEGGMSTGQPIIVRAAMKPIATTITPQKTVNLAEGKEMPTQYERSDYCPVPRAVPVIEAMVAYTLADALLEKLGGDSLAEIQPRFDNLAAANLEDLHMDGQPHIFWPNTDENQE
jgi:chorismate synthase